ncbi:hypothetical protein X805_15000 [Sphaerotilus natans subsp. natans DSM 6575]|uniref:Metallopeptidase domain-containing protein n=1 Tax=Sphaerotilus natans subsp. natans DSM 6575 TaxID=1286631 RepID=A0A059KN60_9BURK|nr:VWA-like domain-containing protein [Sphaerotilus natans]KDB52896.1 hypothetical protein X805_15000 [Sphaerotilus natans subsp. natans DSM 6575]SIS05278.1 Predicted metal-dependent peptidase [Sphaerotilus natans]
MKPIPCGSTSDPALTELDDAGRRRWLQQLEQDRSLFLLRHPFTASLTLHLAVELVLDPRLPTAATDGRRIYFNPNFLATLDAAQRLFVMAHEVWHCVAGHLGRQQNRQTWRWNLAIDHEVNWLLVQDGFKLPPGAVLFPSLRGCSAEQVYSALLDRSTRDLPTSFDLHELPEGLGEPMDELLRAQWQQRLRDALKQHRHQGDLPDGLAQLLDLPPATARLPWRVVLRDFMLGRQARRRGWERPSRRHWHRGLWLPDLRPDGLRLMLALDTSGSTRRLLPLFMAEITELMSVDHALELTLVECDTRIRRARTFRSGEDLSALASMRLRGGGGTDLRPPFDLAAQDPPDALIFLTDGKGRAPQKSPPYPVMWVLPELATAPVEWGETLTLYKEST